MSGVGGNTSRLVGTAKYVTNNQTQCLRRSMSNVANQSNNITRNSATQVKSNDLSNCQYARKQQDTQDEDSLYHEFKNHAIQVYGADQFNTVGTEDEKYYKIYSRDKPAVADVHERARRFLEELKKASAEYWNIMSAAANKISSIAKNLKNTIITGEGKEEEKPLESKVGKFNLSLYGGTVTLKARGIDNTYYWDAPLNIEGDKELMEKLQNTIAVKKEVKAGKFNLSFDNDELTLKVRGSPHSFTLNHKLDITEKSAKSLQDKILADYGTPRNVSKFFPQDNHFIVSAYDTKITIKTREEEKTVFPKLPNEEDRSSESVGTNGLPIEEYIEENQIGIKTKENDKTFVLKHTINIKMKKEEPVENLNNAVENFLKIFRGNDKLEIIINSGEGTLSTQENDESMDFENSLCLVVEMNGQVLNTDFHLGFKRTEPYVSEK